MDRGTKLMFAMLTAAVCLMVIMMMSRETPQAHAQMYQGDRGEEPTIVSFRVTPWTGTGFNTTNYTPARFFLLTRMWSNGAVEVNVVGDETIPDYYDNIANRTCLEDAGDIFDGWKLVSDSVAGFRCAGDTDGNRVVNSDDVLRVIADYGNCEQDPPLNLPPDSDQ